MASPAAVRPVPARCAGRTRPPRAAVRRAAREHERRWSARPRRACGRARRARRAPWRTHRPRRAGRYREAQRWDARQRPGERRAARPEPVGRHARRQLGHAGDAPARAADEARSRPAAAARAACRRARPDEVARLGPARAREHERIAVVVHVGARRAAVGGGDEHGLDAVGDDPRDAEHVAARARRTDRSTPRASPRCRSRSAPPPPAGAPPTDDDGEPLARRRRRASRAADRDTTAARRRDVGHGHDPRARAAVGAQQARGLRIDRLEPAAPRAPSSARAGSASSSRALAAQDPERVLQRLARRRCARGCRPRGRQAPSGTAAPPAGDEREVRRGGRGAETAAAADGRHRRRSPPRGGGRRRQRAAPPPAACAPAAPATSASTPSPGTRRRSGPELAVHSGSLLRGRSRAAAVAADEQHGAGAVAGGDERHLAGAVERGDEDAHAGRQPALADRLGVGGRGGDGRARAPVAATSTLRAAAGSAPNAHVRLATGSKYVCTRRVGEDPRAHAAGARRARRDVAARAAAAAGHA